MNEDNYCQTDYMWTIQQLVGVLSIYLIVQPLLRVSELIISRPKAPDEATHV